MTKTDEFLFYIKNETVILIDGKNKTAIDLRVQAAKSMYSFSLNTQVELEERKWMIAVTSLEENYQFLMKLKTTKDLKYTHPAIMKVLK